MSEPIRLTSLSHGGGCGCKLSPAVLRDLLAGQATGGPFAPLLVGVETGDDAAVWQLDERTCIVATTDFFMPMVDDARDFGRIAATNALSDVYAMGGTPLFALAILGMPLGRIAPEQVREILAGGASVCAEAGIPVAGGHSIDSPEPIYGLAVVGAVAPGRVRRNCSAQQGDVLLLTKALGVGIYSAAIKKDRLDRSGYDEMIASTTLLNRIGAELAGDPAVHAMTDVTGFGLLGHALEMAAGSGLGLAVDWRSVPLLDQAHGLAELGCVTGASGRNWASYGDRIRLPEGLADWQRHLLTDPQTSGGLLVSCAPERADALLRRIREAGYPRAAAIGRVEGGAPVVSVTG